MDAKADQGTQSSRSPSSSERNDPGSNGHPSSSSGGRRAAERTAASAGAPPPPVVVSGPPSARAERTLEVHGAAARVIARALDSTLDANAQGSGTPPTSSDRLAMLAAHLPSVPRDAYAVGNQVAKGGIGRVMRARDQRLDRPVAIKELLVWNEAQEQRFVREALLTARLQHPAIVPIYEAGRWPDGEPFYAMKLVSGTSLADLIAERKTLEERLSLLPHVITVAQAVAYAHSQHILHRDLKPANVLVGEFGETVVIDWGLAKGLAEQDVARPGELPVMSGEGLTIEGAVVGTPAYMPPEQAAGSPVDERADIYAIGAMLYHLIAAVPPYHDTPWEKMLAAISGEPPRPVEEHAPAISDELSAIVHKAMARSPGERYRTAKELADDLQRFTSGQIVAAHTYSATQLLRRFWRRNRSILSIAASAVVLVTLVVIGAFVKTDHERRIALEKKQEAEEARQAADTARGEAEGAGRQATARADEMTLLQAQGALQRDPNEAVAWLKTLSPSFAEPGEVRRIASDARARGLSRAFRGHTAHVNNFTFLDGGKRFVSASDDKTLRVWDVATATSRVLAGHTDEVWRVEPLPGDTRIVSLSKDSTARVWDVATGAELAKVTLPALEKQVVVRPDGSVLFSPQFDGPGAPLLWVPGTSELRTLAGPAEEIEGSTASYDGKWALTQRKDGTASLIEVDTGEQRAVGEGPHARGLWVLAAGGRRAVHHRQLGGKEQEFELWDMKTMTHTRVTIAGNWAKCEISERGSLLALSSEQGIDVYDLEKGSLVRRLPGTGTSVYWQAFSKDERQLVAGHYDKLVRVWDLRTGGSRVHAGLLGVVSRVDFAPGDRAVLASSTAGDIRLFEPSPSGVILTDHRAPSQGLAVAADGRNASIDENGLLRVVGRTGEPIAEHALGAAKIRSLLVSPDGARFAGAALPAQLVQPRPDAKGASATLIFGTFDGAKPAVVEMPSLVQAVAWHPGGAAVIAALDDGTVYRIALDGTRTEVDRVPVKVMGLSVSPDGASLAVGCENGLVRWTDLATGEHRDLGRHAERVWTLAFTKTGDLLATGSFDHTIRLWRLADGSFRSIDASGAGVRQVAFSRDEKEVFVMNENETILRRWGVESGEPRLSFTGHGGPLTGFSLSRDGRRVLTRSLDRTARIFDVATGKSRALVGHEAREVFAAFTADDKLVITLGHEGAVRAWPDDLPETLPELRAWLDAATPDRIEVR